MTETSTPSCLHCRWVEHFRPRQDEIDRGHLLGCRKPNYEGYTSATRMACGGVFFRPIAPSLQATKEPPPCS
jgi:hypothetical protein